MEGLGPKIFFNNWGQKILAVLAAVIVWFLVNNSITATKVIPNVAVRVINLPKDKTIEGLLPNGLLKRRVSLSLTGTKELLDHLDANDLEVVIDATNKGDEWLVRLGRLNLSSTNPEIDLSHHIATVTHSEFTIKLTKLVTAKIPVIITEPVGEPPKGYQFLDVWPQKLFHTICGPEASVEELRNKGIHLVFDLRRITEAELNGLQTHRDNGLEDEVSFVVPSRWRRVVIPFLGDEPQEINDPNAAHLRIDFLKQELLVIDRELPIRIFYPVKYTNTLNPNTFALTPNELVQESHDLMTLHLPLYSRNVSRLFLDVTRDNLEITLIPINEQGHLRWSIQFINSPQLENEYVKRLMPYQESVARSDEAEESEEFLRNRFREYMQKFELLKSNEKELALESRIDANKVTIHDITE